MTMDITAIILAIISFLSGLGWSWTARSIGKRWKASKLTTG